jgi:hypothetical protein
MLVRLGVGEGRVWAGQAAPADRTLVHIAEAAVEAKMVTQECREHRARLRRRARTEHAYSVSYPMLTFSVCSDDREAS